MIEFKKVCKSFADKHANNNIEFRCLPGTITGLLGVNGAGKSTALKILSGLIKPDAGDVHVNGISVGEQPRKAQAQLGLLLTSQGLYPHLSARENIEFYAAMQGVKNVARATSEVIETLQMQEIAERKVAGFSTGESMKVSLARALVHKPKYLVLDEPSRGLDVLAIAALRELLLDLKQQGCCILFSSHVMQEIDILCDQLVVIDDGQVCFQGNLDSFKQEHTTLEKSFIHRISNYKQQITKDRVKGASC
ncbi:ATP-binding cassette domain-containing protein [Thalassotalea litorea]|uniref:ATP-binding cassette domain-containing protein n=1 Tax=Thalassotalea litorea TaxID=2020715 RepID=A0A5R9IJS1_9GAMM|nr:ATP-binding cassette domain-containing protein [Thalassotalea litorea]TLU65800.1 ATP-binding cassette domain-containing protein [Thalassotalea litorea]